jgi:putative phosphoribosyl transferase
VVAVFADRADAGRRLAERLAHWRGADVVVLGLPRGGIPVAYEIARALGAPLDVLVVRKLGVPFQPELGMGAIGEDGVRVINPDVVRMAAVTAEELDEIEARERAELERRVRRYRGDRPRVPVAGRVAVVVDDGIATGSTARAACRVVRAQGASRVVLAAPVAPPGWDPGEDADEFVCVARPPSFFAIGQFYDDFTQTTDEQVLDCLARAAAWSPGGHGDATGPGPGSGAPADPAAIVPGEAEVGVDTPTASLPGSLTVPAEPTGLVLFAHGSGSSRHSPRNRLVAATLNRAGLATLLFDLLTPSEELDRANVFDVELLGSRLVAATRWAAARPGLGRLPVGYFGASTGAAAALWAAAELGDGIGAVVSRGGRPDLAGARLAEVTAPTLLIVGGLDRVVLDLNREAMARMRCERRLEVVPGATHLFEEPGTLDEVARLACEWFRTHLVSAPAAAGTAG